MKKLTRTQKLTKKINKIYEDNRAEIKALKTVGPKGGSNAAYIDGWTNSGNSAITRAVNLSKMPTMSHWSGSNPTPSTAIPTCAYGLIKIEYNKIFNELKKYRFDNSYEIVFELKDNNYISIGSFYSFGITKKMSYNEAVKRVKEWKLYN